MRRSFVRNAISLCLATLLIAICGAGWVTPAQAALGDYRSGWGSPYAFSAPKGLAIGPDGHVYMADEASLFLTVFDTAGTVVRRFSPGIPGQSGGFSDVAIAPDGRVYALGGPGTIGIFEANGAFVGWFGREGAGDGQFYWAVSLAVSASGEVFVADWWNHRMSVFDRNGVYLRKWPLPIYPSAMAFAADGRLYATDYYGSVYAYDGNGAVVDRWYAGYGIRLNGLALDEAAREAYVMIEHTGEVLVFSLDSTGYSRQPVRTWHGDESGVGRVSAGRAKDVVVAPGGAVIIAEGHNYNNPGNEYGMLKVYDRDGAFQSVWRKSGDAPGRFSYPTGVTVSATGQTYVLDNGNRRIQVFDAAGILVSTLPLEEGWEAREIEVAENGDLYLGATGIVDGLNTCFIRVLSPSGELLRQWPVPSQPWTASAGGLAVAGDRVYVSYTTQVLIFTTSGTQVGSLYGNPLDPYNSLRGAREVEVGPDGLISVLDARGIVTYTPAGAVARYLAVPGTGGVIATFALDACGNVFTLTSPQSSYNPGIVRAFDGLTGQFLGQWGGEGVENGFFRAPFGIATDQAGGVLVVDRDNHRVQVFAGAGSCGQPVAAAGPDVTTHPGRTVALDGSSSTDPAGRPLTYSWELISAPSGSTVALANGSGVAAALTPDLLGDYLVELTVTNSHGSSSEPDQLLVTATNEAPVADAGPDQAVILIGTQITLAGGGFDSDGDPLAYSWEFLSRPDQSGAVLTDAASPAPSFLADRNGSYLLGLTVSDPWGGTATDTVLVSFTNVPPVADAGRAQTVLQGTLVQLDGSASSDANGDLLGFSWQLVQQPEGSTAALAGAASASPTFIADLPGPYAATLVVEDGIIGSAAALVTVTAVSYEDALTGDLADLLDLVNSFPDAAFAGGGQRNALGNKINAVIAMVEAGNYTGATNHLTNDILPKMDGCTLGGGDRVSDWIVGCVEQGEAYALVVRILALLRQLTA